jgi:hypothetical protein
MMSMAALLSATAHAATYTCVDSAGKKSFSDRPCPASAAEAARRDIAPSGVLSARHGLTFGVLALADGSVDARCQAAPAPIDRPREGGCDSERGDTLCTRALPVLCFKPGERRARAPTTVDVPSGRVAAPPPAAQPLLGASALLRGERLASRQSGTQACVEALGAGWRMASVNDSASWAPQAQRHASLSERTGRLWVATEERRGNCWSELPSAPTPDAQRPPVPVDEKQIVADLLKLRSNPEFARLPLQCRQSYDKMASCLKQNTDGALPSEASFAPLMEWLQECGAGAAATAPPR